MRILLAVIVSTALLVSCGEKQKAAEASKALSSMDTISTHVEDSLFLGESFDIEHVVAVSELVLESGDSATLVARGTVKEVCQAKGCWMTLETGDEKSMRVTFKEYGFFMPKNLAGKEVIMKGKASYTTTDVATLQHLAADAGKTQAEIDQITEPEHALTFLASGVTIVE